MVENREVKSDVFSMLMEDKKNALQVYNALNGSKYTDPELVELVTLEKGISLTIRNDAAFIVDMNLNIYEHQSTYNPNMPIRALIYLAEVLKPLIKKQNIYGRSKILIPTPHFAVFYNGIESRPEKEIVRLSDLFSTNTDKPEIEIECVIYNINADNNGFFLESCPILKEYMHLIDKVRYYESIDDDSPISSAIQWCIENHILEEFLKDRGPEVLKAMTLDYTFERREELTRRDALEEGREEGRAEGYAEGRTKGCVEGRTKALSESILVFLSEMGPVPENVISTIQNADADTLSKWIKLVVKCGSVDDFIKRTM